MGLGGHGPGAGCSQWLSFVKAGAWVGVCTSQATKDLTTAATLAFQDDDLKSQAEAAPNWAEIERSFWSRSAEQDQESSLKTPKLKRTKVYEWLCATTHMLLVATGNKSDIFPQTVFSCRGSYGVGKGASIHLPAR